MGGEGMISKALGVEPLSREALGSEGVRSETLTNSS